ncbi:hypothetical protein HZH66_012827 [Vespula vulgaris]|uniref:Uncharacterized protein n=1 Tax=Vespula vulgaris TaxID=7454 RepID=A0A834MSA1_VESVU|nr:hypothetical protein HZH66_012827 [Vespula vulgaris]
MKNKTEEEEEEEEEDEDEEDEEEEEEVSQRHIRILRELNSGSVSFERRQCPDQRSLQDTTSIVPQENPSTMIGCCCCRRYCRYCFCFCYVERSRFSLVDPSSDFGDRGCVKPASG